MAPGLAKVVSGDVFNIDTDVPVAFLPRVSAPVGIKEYLMEGGTGPSIGSSMVTSVCRCRDGEVAEVSIASK